jgi:peptidoglycan/LPS O-acetylase OafA/YrhL
VDSGIPNPHQAAPPSTIHAKPFYPALAGLRGIAAAAVLAFHGVYLYSLTDPAWRPGLVEDILARGWVGVDLFFVLSAFLLGSALIFDQERTGGRGILRRFMVSRWLRILPAFALSIPLALMLAPMVSGAWVPAADLFAHLLFIHNLDGSTFFSINPVYWTLAVEFQACLILPFIVAQVRKKGWTVFVLAAVVLTVFWRAATNDPTDPVRSFVLAGTVPGFLAHFALGAGAARLAHDGRLPFGLSPTRLLVASVAGVSLTLLVIDSRSALTPVWTEGLEANPLLRPLLALFFSGTVLALALGEKRAGGVLRSRSMRAVGKTSYGTYLVHFPVGLFLVTSFADIAGLGLGVFLAVQFVASTSVSAVFYAFVESPMNRIRVGLRAARPALT